MILSLPWTSWLLLIMAVGLGLALSLAFYLAHRHELTSDGGSPAARADAPPARPTIPDLSDRD